MTDKHELQGLPKGGRQPKPAKHISTTALARLLGKESKELFVLLTGGGWIVKVDGHWQLTEKGKFEGGLYVNHPKYGEYIAWPESVQEHPLLQLLPEAPLTASNLAIKWELPARLVNWLLAEHRLIRRHVRGWLLTAEGARMGGRQQEAENSGVPYVSWPETIVDNAELLALAAQLRGDEALAQAPALDGQRVNNPVQRRVNNWLYLARVVHARHYRLAWGQEVCFADFYVPELQLCIECWADELAISDARAQVLQSELEKQALYKKHGQDAIEFRDEAIAHIDEQLARELLKRGLAVY